MSWILLIKEALKKVAVPLLMELGKVVIGKLGEAPSINNTNKPLDIEQISNDLEELRNFVSKEAKPVFDGINSSVVDYVEECFLEIDEREELLSKYDISMRVTIDRLKYIQRESSSYWQDNLFKRISIDNTKCRLILKLPPGEKKQADIMKFTQEVIKEIVSEQAEILKGQLEDIYTDLEKRVEHSAQRLENKVRNYSQLIDSMDNKDEENFKNVVEKAMLKRDVCSILYGKVGE